MSSEDLHFRVKQLETQLQRERMARKKAEDVLRQKTLELFDANERITTATRRLQSALWASGESVWEWFADDNIYRLYTSLTEREVVIQSRGTLDELMSSLSEKSAAKFQKAWTDHINNQTRSFDVVVHRKSSTSDTWRWLRICGRIVSHNADGSPKQFIGILKDITEQYEQDQTFRIITQTYLRTEQPGFIIKLDNKRIEGTDSMFTLLGGTHKDIGQEELRKMLPVDTILANQASKNRLFKHPVLKLSGESIDCEFILPKMLEDEGKEGVYSFVVGFFRPSKK